MYQVFDRIKTVASAKIVQEVNAIFHFKLSDASYVVDLKNGDGSVAKVMALTINIWFININ